MNEVPDGSNVIVHILRKGGGNLKRIVEAIFQVEEANKWKESLSKKSMFRVPV
jgi:hypothetical protein